MKRFRKVYVEISNICNMKCSFCPGTKRRKHAMTEEEFRHILGKLEGFTDFLYFHLMGEPLLHPKVLDFLNIAQEKGFRVILTTNGTLLQEKQAALLAHPAVHKVNISLHAFEANEADQGFEEYLRNCLAFSKAAVGKKLVSLRLWNQGALDTLNPEILKVMKEAFSEPWTAQREGFRLADKIYLNYGEKFDWPDLGAEETGNQVFCYGLRDQLGVLCDGTVVPCCLDHEGDIPLGNLFDQSLPEILDSPRAKALYDGFTHRCPTEELCRRCGYAKRFV